MALDNVDQIVSQMRAALQLSEPELDTTVGATARKILDAVAEAIAENAVERYLLDYQYDIDTKRGADLDDFGRLFGFARFPAKRAVGMVTFERTNPATETILIPLSTQLSTEGISPLVVQTTTPALLIPPDVSIQVPVQAVFGGSAGNIAQNSLRRRITPLDGITSFSNTALTGGADAESDEQFRDRIKRTIFRGMAGTEGNYLGIALDDESVTQANVLGASKSHRETIEIISGTAASSIDPGTVRYVYPGSAVFGRDIDNGDIFVPNLHYTFDDTVNPPEVDIPVLAQTEVVDGVYDLEYEYVPMASRNDPDNGITNRIDIWVNGNRPTEANEVVIFDASKLFTNTSTDDLYRLKFLRSDGVSNPQTGNFFVPFAFSPVIDPSINDVIELDGLDLVEGTDYWLVNDITAEGGTPTSMSGIEIRSEANGGQLSTNGAAEDGEPFDAHYLFNSVPRDIEEAARQWRLITTDVKVHQARPVHLNFFLGIIFNPGYPPDVVQDEIEGVLSLLLSSIGFNGVVQVSDILGEVHNIDGVDAVRFLTDADGFTVESVPVWAIEQVTPEGLFITRYDNGGTPERAVDVVMGDDEYPVFNGVYIKAFAQNSFGAV